MTFCSVDVLSELHMYCCDVTIATYQTSTFPKWKLPYLLLQSLTEFLVLVLCNDDCPYSLMSTEWRSRANNTSWRRKLWLIFTLWMESAWSSLCCHGIVTVDLSWIFVMSITPVQSFSSIQKKGLGKSHFLWFCIILCQRCDVTIPLIRINPNLE